MKYAALVAVLGALTVAGDAWAEDYRAEAEQIAADIIRTHPRGNEISSSTEFAAAREDLYRLAADTDLAHYAIALGRLFHSANDGHTALLPVHSGDPIFAQRYPLRLKRFDDGLYVVAAKGDAAKLLGARITSIGGRKINALLRDFASAQAAGNRAWPANWTALGVTIPGLLIGLDAAQDLQSPVQFEGSTAAGRRVSAMLTPEEEGAQSLAELFHASTLLAQKGDGMSNYLVELEGGRVLVLVIGAMEDAEGKSFEQFYLSAQSALEISKVERIIIDLRENGGGNNMLAEPLRRLIIRSRFNRPGGIYVLTSPMTFSAAQNFATRIERESDALFVGEPTGGAPNHFGDAKFAIAPQSRLPYVISTLRWQDSTPFDDRPWIAPDIAAPPTFADYVAGRDLALERALKHQPAASEEENWRRRAMAPWERASQKADWRFFYEAPTDGAQ